MPTHSDYTVGWISALPLELAASMAMLDGDPHPQLASRSHSDQNIYTLGNICGHNVVMACLPAGRTGIHNAATVAEQMKATFQSIRFGLMVGIGGGVPSKGHDIRLGDVVVSKPSGQFGGVVQYDFGKTVKGGAFERTGSLNAPPLVLLNAVSTLIARHELRRNTKFTDILSSTLANLSPEYTRPTDEDRLFEAKYNHAGGETCAKCDPTRVVVRSPAQRDIPLAHYGTIGCANRVIKDGVSREILREDYKILCVEMEAAGLMNDFPCLVIRGICDYADTHKNYRWQRYAATVAAAYAKELLSIIPPAQVAETPAVGTLSSVGNQSNQMTTSTVPVTRVNMASIDSDEAAKKLEFSILTAGCLGPDEAALGRLVLNLTAPDLEYCPHEPVPVLRKMVSVIPFPSLASIIANRNKSRLTIFLSTLFKGKVNTNTIPDYVGQSAKTSRLLNSGTFFKQLLQDRNTKIWLEEMHKKVAIYLTVGLHSFSDIPGRMSDEASDREATFSTPGNRIIGVRYRRVCVRRVNIKDDFSADLEFCARWKRYIDNPDRDSGEPEYMEAALDGEDALEDAIDDLENDQVDVYHSDETGENFVLLVNPFQRSLMKGINLL